MPAPLSKDMRKWIIEAKDRGDTVEKIACEKSIDKSTVSRICKLYRETGSHDHPFKGWLANAPIRGMVLAAPKRRSFASHCHSGLPLKGLYKFTLSSFMSA